MIGRTGLLLVSLCLGTVHAQVTTATFYAAVADSSDAVIPGATVTFQEERTGAVRSQVTDTNGECAFTFLPIGTYTVTVTAAGFKTLALSELTLEAGQNERRRLVLEIGNVVERVLVRAEAPLLNTVSAEQMFVQNSKQIEELPLTKRRASDLFTIGTAIQRSVPTGAQTNNAGAFRMNGLGGAAINVTMDGIPASGHPGSQQAGMRGGFNYVEIVSLEAIEEIGIAKGAFAAEFAHAMSGNINVTTKSGTNQWHGSLFEGFNAEELNARSWFLAVKPPSVFNQFGGSLGGPIWKDRIFIFGVYEGYRDRRTTTVQGVVFTPRMRNDLITRNPGFQPIIDLLYLPNQPFAPTAATALFIGPGAFNANTNHFVIKPDVQLSSTAKLTATWLRDRPDVTLPVGNPGPRLTRTFFGRADRINVTFTTFRANWSAETRFGRNRVDSDRVDQIRDILGQQLGISAIGVNVDGERNFIGNAPHWIIEQKVTLQRGRHSLKFGGLLHRAAMGQSLSHSGLVQYNTEQDLLNNTPTSARFDFGTKPWVGRLYNAGFFLQDDWKVSPKLVINVGLRYDYFGRQTVKGVDGSSSPSLFLSPFTNLATFTQGPVRPPDNAYDSDPMNLGPRFGFAYNPDGAGKTVIRGGFGLMFMPPGTSIFDLIPLNGPDLPFRAQPSKIEVERLGIRYPITIDRAATLIQSPGSGIRSGDQIASNLQGPYAMNFTLGVQRALTPSLMLETAFVGSAGRKLITQRIYNVVNRITGLRPNPSLGQGRLWDNSDSTHYTSWQTSLRKRYSRGMTGSVHYTWGKAISYADGDLSYANNNNAQEFFNLRAERGRAKEDLQHAFVGSLIYDLPVFANSAPLLRTTLGGWQVSNIFRAQTGYPIDIIQGSATAANPYSRPDLLDFNGAILNSGLQWLNRAAFAQVPFSPVSGIAIRPGTIGRYALNAPGRWNLDFALAKNVRIREGMRIQFRAEMINAFNHVDLVNVSTDILVSTFGRLTGATDPRAIQFHMRLSF